MTSDRAQPQAQQLGATKSAATRPPKRTPADGTTSVGLPREFQQRIGNHATHGLVQMLSRQGASPASAVQAKLRIGRADEVYEREADDAAALIAAGKPVGSITEVRLDDAARVRRQPSGGPGAGPDEEEGQRQAGVGAPDVVTESPSDEREEDAVQLAQLGGGDVRCEHCDEDEEEDDRTGPPQSAVQMASAQGATLLDSAGAERAMDRSGGTPMGRDLEARMERGFGVDFSGVRVHTNASAEEAARTLGARAFTRGSDVYLGRGESTSDVHLMAHELTHVVQQQSAQGSEVVRRKPDKRMTFQKVVRFPYVDLGIPRETPGRELAIRFHMRYDGVSRAQAERAWDVTSPSITRGWTNLPEEFRKSGIILVRVDVIASDFQPNEMAKETGEGTLPGGRTEGHTDRATEFWQLPPKDKDKINAETDKRYEETFGLKEKIKKGEKGKAEVWLRVRDQVLAERQYMNSLPERAKRFLHRTVAERIKPEDYPQWIRIAKVVMDMTDEEVNDFLSVATRTDDLNAFEKSLTTFVEGARGADGTGREKGEGEGGEGGKGGRKGDSKGGSKYGRYGLIDLPPEIIKVLEVAAEILGHPEEMTDLLDLLDEITELQNVTADVVNLLDDPDKILMLALGLIDNPAAAAVDRWVFKPAKRGKIKPSKTKGIKGVLQKVKKALPIVKKLLKPVFMARRKSMAVQFRAALLIDKLPASTTEVLGKVVSGGATTRVEGEIASLSDAIAKRIATDLESVPNALAKIEATETIELINKEELGRIVAKLTVKLAGGIYGKVASKAGLDDVIADIAKHATKYTIPDTVVDGINKNLTRIITKLKPPIDSAATEVADVLNGIEQVLREQLTPELMTFVSPKAATPEGVAFEGSRADFMDRLEGSSGRRMSGQLSSRMEGAFGRDFSRVRIHTDQSAQEASRQIGAEAFTVGRDVYFAQNRFDERSKEGLGLVGHELAHVVQRDNGGAADVLRERRTKDSLREQLSQRVVGRVVRGTGKTKRSIRGQPFIDYGALDGKGRPMGIIARLKGTPGQGSSASSRIRPPGFKGGPAGHARCHLLGSQLGGSGREERNLVACHQALNNTDMKSIENRVRRALKDGETILYKVTPLYRPNGRMPYKIRIVAKSDGSMRNIDETFVNRK